MVSIFDTHAHYDDKAFDADREILFSQFPEKGVFAVTNIATDMKSSEQSVFMTERYQNMYGTVGIFPSEVSELENPFHVERMKELSRHDKIVAIGEIGLDYHYEDTDKALQKKWFAGQMEIAREVNLPISVHSRDAAFDTIQIMRECHAESVGGVIHCYSYSKESARDFLNMGFYFGIGGVITFKNAKKLKEAVAYIPLDRIVLETDAPYLTPEPFRGKRNDSTKLIYVAEAIAAMKQIPVEEVYAQTWENAHRMYKIAQTDRVVRTEKE